MQSKQQFGNSLCHAIVHAAVVALAIATLFALTVVLNQSAQAQTFSVIHTFSDRGDGGNPEAGVTIDQAGNFYGTTTAGGGFGDGAVFRLSKKGSNWILNSLYTFAGGGDGVQPSARVIFGPDGSLYGTTFAGGGGYQTCLSGCGTVFNLKPPKTACKTALCPWTETVLYRFSGSDGANPGLGDLIFDQAGNLYGTTTGGGAYGEGTVFELLPSLGGWTEKVLYSFTGRGDGVQPWAGLVFDNAGNLYGTTTAGGTSSCLCGTVFQLTPDGTEKVLYSFQGGNDGSTPYGGLIVDQSGKLYGTATYGGQDAAGTVFELTPADGSWTYSVVYSFTGSEGPAANLVSEGGNLYGTSVYDGSYERGNVFELTPSGGSWTYNSLYDFTGGSDGAGLACNVTFDVNGNLYGTTYYGGASGNGVVWEITP